MKVSTRHYATICSFPSLLAFPKALLCCAWPSFLFFLSTDTNRTVSFIIIVIFSIYNAAYPVRLFFENGAVSRLLTRS